ncbi:MAG TPA: DUF4440 domain-containing protein [Gemmatimonadales bacterium]|jgi:ketosteroid isomerase-like protein|nr:DUF4440 domain-containing protein [Gemmatimonadales bacterium]
MARFGGRAIVPFLLALPPGAGSVQSGGYPTRPRPLPEAEEIAFAMSAAPREISANATIYVLRESGPAKARDGSNGCTCMVSRDLHAGSLYPICYDREASASVFHQELLELRLRFEGKTEEEVKRAVAAAYAAGTLRPPARPALSYMMSPRQVLFSSPLAEGRRVGPWHPHLMLSLPFATAEQFGLAPHSSVDVIQVDRGGEATAQLIVKVPQWADGPSLPAPPLPGAPHASPAAGQAAARETLRLAEQELSQAAFGSGLSRALAGAMADDAVLLLEGAPIVRGRAAIERLLAAQTALREGRVSWEPFRVLVSSDGTLGVTFGGTVAERPGSTPNPGRYFTVWRRGATGAWQVAGHQQIGLLKPGEIVLSSSTGAVSAEPDGNPFAQADLAFAKLAADSGAPLAFARFVAPDGMTFAGTGELNIGPSAVRARLAHSPVATGRWAWRPQVSFVAASGDLGVTIGEATIQRTDVEPTVTNYSKYLTVWLRQPDGSLKFVVDGGSGRPAPR